ncbi:hypothetical protein BJ508DRAFT_309139 [Ascobolus immersus RN42]|uniref:Uncharacterized protein n=1 Tax=Ascobolus immersus RN42 TaxID=1160509 RepID=A0A3N4I324_ASCIM|nr:hypothetical protein BJ508DRAFT_309139 [Ascobolus immersus RN42]
MEFTTTSEQPFGIAAGALAFHPTIENFSWNTNPFSQDPLNGCQAGGTAFAEWNNLDAVSFFPAQGMMPKLEPQIVTHASTASTRVHSETPCASVVDNREPITPPPSPAPVTTPVSPTRTFDRFTPQDRENIRKGNMPVPTPLPRYRMAPKATLPTLPASVYAIGQRHPPVTPPVPTAPADEDYEAIENLFCELVEHPDLQTPREGAVDPCVLAMQLRDMFYGEMNKLKAVIKAQEERITDLTDDALTVKEDVEAYVKEVEIVYEEVMEERDQLHSRVDPITNRYLVDSSRELYTQEAFGTTFKDLVKEKQGWGNARRALSDRLISLYGNNNIGCVPLPAGVTVFSLIRYLCNARDVVEDGNFQAHSSTREEVVRGILSLTNEASAESRGMLTTMLGVLDGMGWWAIPEWMKPLMEQEGDAERAVSG